jgi:hypothetical protein
MTTLGNLVRRVATAHGIAEGAEVVERQGLRRGTWYNGDATGLVVGGDVTIQGRGQSTCAIVKADQFLEGGGIGVHKDRVRQGIDRVLAVLCRPTQNRGAVSERGYRGST